MKPYQDLRNTLYNMNFMDNDLPAESVQMVCSSPPYWGLRKYSGEQDLIWGGQVDCEHEWIAKDDNAEGYTGRKRWQHGESRTSNPDGWSTDIRQHGTCSLCGAWKGAYGLEPTPEMYVQHTIEILREIRRVLRNDGVVFWNIGDSYAGYWGDKYAHKPFGEDRTPDASTPPHKASLPFAKSKRIDRGSGRWGGGNSPASGVLKPKDLCLIPFRVALEAQKPYQEFTIKELSDRAWLAGIVDGEGCIGIHHVERDDRGNHYHQFQPFISVGSIDLPLIERIVRITRMNGTRQKTEAGDVDRRGINSRHANYEWRVEGTNAIKIIEDVFPNLTIKRNQAKIAYELAECHAPHTGKGHKVPADITAYKLKLWQMIKDCNQRIDIEVNLPDVPQHIEPGWWVRSVIIWSKPNPMPESVTDRPTESHEYILMLTKNSRYYWDADAVREPAQDWGIRDRSNWSARVNAPLYGQKPNMGGENGNYAETGRNIRSVWEFPTQPYPEAHFAVFPEKLPELCIKAATPEVGCCSKCGSPWERVTETKFIPQQDVKDPAKLQKRSNKGMDSSNNWGDTPRGTTESKTLGWQPTCKCNADKVPSIVLDPFAGAGTTLWVAKKLNRKAVGYEISEEYCQLIIERIRQQVML